jgi:SAM-dependent methyltransferase
MQSDLATHARASLECACCGAGEPVLRGRKRGRFVPAEFTFYSCRVCGFLFVDPIVDFAIYDDRYYAGQGPDPLVNYEREYLFPLAAPRSFEFANLRELAVAHGTSQPAAPAVRWLDYGCGAGGLLKYLRLLGPIPWGGRETPLELTGHDVGSYAQRLQRDDGFRILGLEEILNEPAESYDVISCVDVIEHLPAPGDTMDLLARLLRPGGLLLLITGNLGAPLARWQGIRFPYCIPEIHISLFDPHSLGGLYRRHGLTPALLRVDGMLRSRLLKNLPLLPPALRKPRLAESRPVRKLLDWIYGVSAMPCAIKPPAGP